MVKRSADGQLTRESWDEDEPSEKPEASPMLLMSYCSIITDLQVGEFNRAPEDVLARRKILVARRRVPERKKEPEVNPFANFKGFKGLSFSTDSSTLAKSSSVTPTTSASFKSDGHDERSTADTVTADNSSSKASDVLPSSAEKESDTSKPFSSVIFEPVIKRSSIDKNDIPSLWKEADIVGSHIEEQPGPRRDKRVIEFVSKIKALNGDFVEHIRKCFQLNPFINFKPNFDDYNEHMKSLQQEHGITDDDSLWIKPETLTKEATVGRRPFAETVSRAASKRSRTDASFVPTAASAVAKEQAGTVSSERKQMHGSGLFQPAQSLSKSIKLTTEATRSEREVGSQFKFSAFTKDSSDDGLKKNDVPLRDDGTKASRFVVFASECQRCVGTL
ncbi:NUP50 domain containing protein [Trichuris trichiura]|uniref:NUP50 domain containing protein n=1 Tax=Trichuris trichiura TaxID=36087 RepID=A0A077ZK99_TRITR|nr:NUP50 domain containing protein [Trichuris trichiura]